MTTAAGALPHTAPASGRRIGIDRVTAYRLLLIIAAILALEITCQLGLIRRTAMIPPSEMATHLWTLLASGTIAADLKKTLGNIIASFVVAVCGGTVLGVIVHRLPRLRRVVDPLLASYYSVPFFVFYPLFIVIFGMNDWPIIMIGVMFAGMAMVINTLNGLDRVPRVFEKVARVHRLSQVQRAVLITLPAAAPSILTGIKLAAAYSFVGVLAAEFILSNSGIGYAISFAYDSFDNRTMYALVLLVLIAAVILNAALHGWEQRILRRTRRA